jgi:hypothetical protein
MWGKKMKMIDLKMPKLSKKEMEKTNQLMVPDSDRWPYGLKLTFEAEQVDKLPVLEKVKVGDDVSISGMGEVTSIRSSENQDGKKQFTVEVQIQKVGVESSKSSPESMADAMGKVEKSRTMKMMNDEDEDD